MGDPRGVLVSTAWMIFGMLGMHAETCGGLWMHGEACGNMWMPVEACGCLWRHVDAFMIFAFVIVVIHASTSTRCMNGSGELGGGVVIKPPGADYCLSLVG